MAKSVGNGGYRDSSTSKNPFFDDDDDVDDFCFLTHPQQGSSGYILGGEQSTEWEQKRQQLLDERRRIEERTLQSSNVSVGLLYETEQVGIATAEELVRQGEQLKNIEYKVDDVNSTLRTSQKHLNVMKSIFGGIKGYFSRGTPETTVRAPDPADSSKPNSKLLRVAEDCRESTAASAKDGYSHPALRHRGIDTSGFADVLEDEDEEKSMPPSRSYSMFSEQVDQQLDRNLGELSVGLGRLKNLAQNLGGEIDEQNETLERLNMKTERADITLQRQNKQIIGILKK